MADIIDYKIIGDDMQIVEIGLDYEEGVRAEVGTFLYMTEGIKMDTTIAGGIVKGIKRVIAGESFFITNFYNTVAGKQYVAFAAPYPGKIIPVNLADFDEKFYCQKDAFLCAAMGVDIDVAFTRKLKAGIFGKEGFILQELKGDGMAFIHAGGTVIEKNLDENQHLRVDTGCLVAFSHTVNYDVQFVGGFKNALFGGEGLFMVSLKGPGKVYLQSLPFSRLANRIVAATKPFAPGKDEEKGITGKLGNFIKKE